MLLDTKRGESRCRVLDDHDVSGEAIRVSYQALEVRTSDASRTEWECDLRHYVVASTEMIKA